MSQEELAPTPMDDAFGDGGFGGDMGGGDGGFGGDMGGGADAFAAGGFGDDGMQAGFAGEQEAPRQEQEEGEEGAGFDGGAHEYGGDAAYYNNDNAAPAAEGEDGGMDLSVLQGGMDDGGFEAMAQPTGGYFQEDGTYVAPADADKGPGLRVEDDENNALRKWEAAHRQEMQGKDDEERAAISKRESEARAERDAFNAERARQIEQTKSANQDQEQVFIADRDAVVDAKNLWDRVSKMIDVKAEGNADVSRFRSLLLQLKHTPV